MDITHEDILLSALAGGQEALMDLYPNFQSSILDLTMGGVRGFASILLSHTLLGRTWRLSNECRLSH